MSGDDFSLDELASASLDNEVTPAERAAASGDAAVTQRVEEFSALRSLLADDGAGFDIDALMARALDEYDVVMSASPVASATNASSVVGAVEPLDEPAASSSTTAVDAATGDGSAPIAPLSQLAETRERRRRRAGRLWTPLAVAAVGLGGVVLLTRLSSGESKSSTAESSELAKTADADASAAATTAAAAAPVEDQLDAAAAARATEAAATDQFAAEVVEPVTAAPALTDAPAATEAPAPASDAAPPGGAPDTLPAIVGPGTATLEPPGDSGGSTVPIVFNTTEQITLYVRGLTSDGARLSVTPLASSCSTGGLAVLDVFWSGQAGVLHVIPSLDAPSEAVIVDAACAVLVRVPLAP